MKTSFLIFLFFFLQRCTPSESKCSFEHVDVDGRKFRVAGCFVDSLENGLWRIYNVQGKLSEWGKYEKGIKVGDWHYITNNQDSVIQWQKYSNAKLGIVTNVPAVMEAEKDSSFFVKFSHKDSRRYLNLVLAINNPNLANRPIDSIQLLQEGDIESRGWTFKRNITKIEAKNGLYYSNQYSVTPTERAPFQILAMYGKDRKGNFVEISCTFSSANEALGRTIFVDVAQNLYVKGVRFIHPFEKISVKK